MLAAQATPSGPLGVHSSDEQTKPVTQSALVVQLVLQAVPEQTRFPAQALGAGNLQLPCEQTPLPMKLGPEQVVALQVRPVGYEQTWLARQTPPQGAVPAQSGLLQQPAFGMHADPQALKPMLQA